MTKNCRIHNDIVKTHCADAYCITGNIQAKRLVWFYSVRMLRRHNRSIHLYKPLKGGNRPLNIAPHWIPKSRLQQHDCVEWNGLKAFISGSSEGRLLLKDEYGNYVARYDNGRAKKINSKSVRFIRRKRGSMIIEQLPKSIQ